MEFASATLGTLEKTVQTFAPTIALGTESARTHAVSAMRGMKAQIVV